MKFNVIFTAPGWDLSGVNTFSANLIEELRNCGISASLLITNPPRQKDLYYTMPLPSNIPVEKLPVEEEDDWQTRWQKISQYLEQKAPCIYIPNSDWSHSCISPKLSNNVAIVGIIHSDDPVHYDHVSRLGKYWNAVVSVSEAINKQTAELCPSLSQRLFTIPYGVNVPERWQQRKLALAPLKLVYAGRLVQYQKRVFDLPKIVDALLKMQIPVELTIIGDGIEGQKLRNTCQPLIEIGAIKFLGTLPNEKVLQVYEQNDIFLLTSDFEGLPVSLLEAMGRGCIPIVSDITSGIPELVQNGVNGFRVSIGDIDEFAKTIAQLYPDLERRREISQNAYRTIYEGGYRTEDMVKEYIDVFESVMQSALSGAYVRPPGEIVTSTYQPLTPQEMGLPPFVFQSLRAIYLKLSGGGMENPNPNLFAKFLNLIMERIARNSRKV